MISAIFFVWSFAATMWTVNALRRPVPPGKRLAPLWLPAMLVSELAPLLFLARALIAAGLIAAGALEHRIGQVGLALFLGSQVGLIPLMARTWRAARDAGASPTLIDLLDLRPGRSAGVVLTRDIEYWDGFTLDHYRGEDAMAAPTLVYVHPGSWMRGRPGRQALPLFYELASSGWVILDIRYPLSPMATFPDHLIGVKRAIAWAKDDQGRRLGVDPSRVAIAGASSGAHLSALAALTWDHVELQPGFEAADTSLIACVPHYGIFDLLIRNGTRYDWPFIARHVLKAGPEDSPDLYRQGSPIDLVRPDAPPFLVVHGDFDSIVLAEESRHFVTALRSAGAPVRYHRVHGGQHGFDAVASLRTRSVARLIAGFLNEVADGVSRVGSYDPEMTTSHRPENATIRHRMRADLAEAMKMRDEVRVRALRTTIAAIENAEAVDAVTSAEGVVGYGDVPRRSVGADQIDRLIDAEIGDREKAATEYDQIGQVDHADVLRAEIQVLRHYQQRP